MNNLSQNIIDLICTYFNKKLNTLDSLRLCSIYLNKIVAPKHFANITINIDSINKRLKTLIRKYKLSINVMDVENEKQLIQLNFYNVKSISFKHFEEKFKYIIPKTVQSLFFSYEDNIFSIKKYVPNLISLNIKLNKPLNKNIFPNSLCNLTLNYNNVSILSQAILPKKLQTITFSTSFNKPLLNIFPTSLKKITFGKDFNQHFIPPPALETLIFGNNFNKSINMIEWPTTLKTLLFGDDFNQLIKKNILPTSLKTLQFGKDFDQIIRKDVLPTGLSILIFGKCFNQELFELTPPVLPLGGLVTPQAVLPLGGLVTPQAVLPIYGVNSPSVLPAYGVNSPSVLPIGLQKLVLGNYFNNNIILPPNLTFLKFGNNFNKPIKLPLKLETLKFGDCYSFPIELPPLIKELRLNYNFKIKSFPPCLEKLKVYCTNFMEQYDDNYTFKLIKDEYIKILPTTLLKLTIIRDSKPYDKILINKSLFDVLPNVDIIIKERIYILNKF